MKGKILYGVKVLNTTVTVHNEDGTNTKFEIGGLAGYIPIFKTKKEAEAVAGDKFELFTITLPKQ